jgi:glycine cleavage system H protein
MVAIFVLLTIAVFVLIDMFLQRAARKKEAPALQAERPSLLDRFVVPKGFFLSRAHAWIEVLASGKTRIGVDDFVQKLVGAIDAVEPLPAGSVVRKGQTLATLRQGGRTLTIPSPLSGTVKDVNPDLLRDAASMNDDPYGAGWIAVIEPNALATELPSASIASGAVQWLRSEISRFRDFINEYAFRSDAQPMPAGVTLLDGGVPVAGILGMTDNRTWERFEREFLVIQED